MKSSLVRRHRSLRESNSEQPRDEGAALIMALVFIILASLIIAPTLSYAIAVNRSGRVEQAKTKRAEAVKGALRTALASPIDLYDACSASGLTVPVQLASPGLQVPISTTCTTVKFSQEQDDTDLPIAFGTTWSGSTAPAGVVGTSYANSGNPDPTLWVADTTLDSTGGRIFAPYLPAHALNQRSATGYMMPSWVGSCRVFFPGTYSDPVTISDGIPTFFTSGIYYFKNTVTFTGSANVVIGGGSEQGCTNDQEAAFEAIGAPSSHNITGFGGTFVFGEVGRLVVNNSVAGSGPNVRFNDRLVGPTEIAVASSKGVAIITVNGVSNGSSSIDLNMPGQLFVPRSLIGGTTPADAMSGGYVPSTLIPTVPLPDPPPDPLPDPLPAPTVPVIEVSFTSANAGSLYIAGYVFVPQGAVNINVAPAMSAGKSVQLLGGLFAAQVNTTPDLPETLQLGIVNRIVQKTFKIESVTTSGTPVLRSIAIVQVNDYGEYVINSWVVQAG